MKKMLCGGKRDWEFKKLANLPNIEDSLKKTGANLIVSVFCQIKKQKRTLYAKCILQKRQELQFSGTIFYCYQSPSILIF